MEAAVSSERPATIPEAFARESAGADSHSATPVSTTTETVDSGAATTAPPVPESATGVTNAETPSAVGEPPKERWDAILKNAREKERADILKEWEPYSWAKQVPREAIDQAVALSRQVQQDPVAFFRQLYEDLDSHPTHAAQLRSEAARLLSRGRGKTPDIDLSPDVEILDANGRVAGRAFSAERGQAMVQHAVQQALAEFEAKKVAPIVSDYESRRAEAEAKKQQAAVDAQVSAMEARIRKIVGNDDAALQAVSQALVADPSADPLDIALQVFEDRAKQTQTKADADALKTLQRKAAASSPNPAAAVVPATKRPRSFHDPALKW